MCAILRSMTHRQIIDDLTYAHFVTFSCQGRRRLLDADQPKRILLRELCDQLKRQDAKCIGFVVMPDHVHAIVWFPEPGQLSRFMHGWKRLASYHIRAWYQSQDYEYFKKAGQQDKFWTPKYYGLAIASEKKIVEKLDYMHLNPVRAGFVDLATQWPWSSAAWYASQQDVGVPIDWVGE